MRYLPIILLFVGIQEAKGQENDLWLTATIRSYHSERHIYNENNPGLGLEYGIFKDTKLVTGFYKNSFEKETIFGGVSYTPLKVGNFHFGGLGARVTGYENTKILGAFEATYEKDKFGFNFLVAPKVPRVSDTWIFTAQFKFNWR